jgi:hypothetical protein
MDEKIRMKLLGDLIDLLQDKRGKSDNPNLYKRPHGNLDDLYVHFFTKRGQLITDDVGAAEALHYLFENIFHFEDFDLTDAFKLELHVH